jgi:hypothetical protein
VIPVSVVVVDDVAIINFDLPMLGDDLIEPVTGNRPPRIAIDSAALSPLIEVASSSL